MDAYSDEARVNPTDFARHNETAKATSVRILVVEDHEQFRRFVCSTLNKKAQLNVVCEVSDGLEAVHKAEELQPDLILLDIGLPSLNGIEAARRICELVPRSKILFLSQESSADIVQGALSVGALGYVAKAKAGSELLSAIRAAIRGKQFVSAGLGAHALSDPADDQVCDRRHPGNVLPNLSETGD
jgi:DNA-binding NarL/FixJ family response regulator